MSAARLSRRVLRTLEEAGAAADGSELVDLREEQARREMPVMVDDDTMQALRDIFAGMNLLEDADKIRLLINVRNEVRKEWGSARDSFLAIGRALLDLDERLSKAELRRLKEGLHRLFPFSDAVASQLRQVARAVVAGRIPRDLCPGSYATAYLLTTLSERELEQARILNLIRPDVPRRLVREFRERIREASVTRTTLSLSDLRAEERQLAERLRTILGEAVRLRQRRREIRSILRS